jgi:SAM-dependent methyltransferase
MVARYAIDGGEAGKQRLDVLASVMHPLTVLLLAKAGVTAGQRCLDVGCGGGHVTRHLAELVGVDGRVVGIDIDANVIELARADANADAIENVEFRVGDAAAIDDGPYEVAYARFLLSHLDDPAKLISSLVDAVAPGGVVIVEDTDFAGCFCHPELPAYRRYVELYRETLRRRGGNADIGPKLPELLHAGGLEDVDLNVCQPAGLGGEAKLLSPLTLERISASVIDEGVASAGEVEQLLAELYADYEDPRSVMSWPRIVQAWGRVPV